MLLTTVVAPSMRLLSEIVGSGRVSSHNARADRINTDLRPPGSFISSVATRPELCDRGGLARGLKARYLQRCLVIVTESAQTLACPKWKRK